MRRLFCLWRGHRWVSGAAYAPKFYTCSRCHEPGFWVAT